MDIYTFDLAPTNTHFQIPFDLTEKAFHQWLNSLASAPDLERAQQLLLALQAINKEKTLPAAKKSLLLESVYKILSVFLKPLHTTLLNSTLPLSPEEQSSIEHIVWIYAELANGFARCITKKSSRDNAQTLFYGLQSSIIVYTHISGVYQLPFPNFWKQSYLFYGFACNLGIQDLNIKQHDFHSDTVNKAFKHLLALYHCGLEQFRPRDIVTISACMEKHTSMMLIDKKITSSNAVQYSAFDLKTDTPPTPLARFEKTEKSALRFFSAYLAAAKICKNVYAESPGTGILKAINYENILQASKTLSFSQKRKFTRFKDQEIKSGIIGFKNIIDELVKSSSLSPATTPLAKTKTYDPRLAEGWKTPDLELVAEGYESLDVMKGKLTLGNFFTEQQNQLTQVQKVFKANNHNYSLDKNIWNNASDAEQQESSSIPHSALNISDNSIKGYKIIFNTADNTAQLQIGDIIGIKNKTSIEVGIIHRIRQLTEHKLQLGIKLLTLESELAYISLPKRDSIYAWALFLPGIKALNSEDSIIFNDNQFQCGEFIDLHRSGQEVVSCRLSKLLHISCAASHIKLFNPKVLNEL
ncbi:MAG: hypothetical protein GQ583_12045 [Methyloprofundus sp.]|nr:hypothetical protein [Methyloprofundus sp.]